MTHLDAPPAVQKRPVSSQGGRFLENSLDGAALSVAPRTKSRPPGYRPCLIARAVIGVGRKLQRVVDVT